MPCVISLYKTLNKLPCGLVVAATLQIIKNHPGITTSEITTKLGSTRTKSVLSNLVRYRNAELIKSSRSQHKGPIGAPETSWFIATKGSKLLTKINNSLIS